MPTLAAFLLSLSWPLAKKILVALGIGVATYAGLSLLASQVQSAVLSSWGQVGGATLAIASLGGVPQSIGIILGAITARVSLVAVGKVTRIAS